jgi:hypothetical protein
MEKEIEELYIRALKMDMPPSVFAQKMMTIVQTRQCPPVPSVPYDVYLSAVREVPFNNFGTPENSAFK